MSDWEFIFDGVFGFLTSPLWEVPIMSFIETQSIVFEPSEEHNESWKEIHEKYKSMIEALLTSYLKDVGITEAQFMKACGSPSARTSPQMQPVYEQLWATEDYEIFKRMMIQRNVELQLQALELIKKRQKKTVAKQAKTQQKAEPTTTSASTEEDEILAEVLRKSEEEYKEAEKSKNDTVYDPSMEAIISESNEEQERLEQEVAKTQEETKQTVISGLEAPPQPVSAASISSSERYEPAPKYEPAPLPAVNKKLNPLKEKEKSKEKELKALRNAPPIKPIIPPVSSKKDETPAKKNESPKEKTEKPQAKAAKASSAEPSKDELLKRAEYLKQQRDRLLALKNKEREKKLNEYTKAKPERPTSARAARQAVSGDVTSQPSEEDQRRMAMRKALADKLKREVVYK